MTAAPAAERDIPEILIAYQDDPQLHLRLGEDRPPSGAELGRRDGARRDRARGRHALTLTIVEPGSDDCRGQVYVHDVDWDNDRARARDLAGAAGAPARAWRAPRCG